jgi:hypothetical protein
VPDPSADRCGDVNDRISIERTRDHGQRPAPRIHEHIDRANRIALVDPIIEAFRLPTISMIWWLRLTNVRTFPRANMSSCLLAGSLIVSRRLAGSAGEVLKVLGNFAQQAQHDLHP